VSIACNRDTNPDPRLCTTFACVPSSSTSPLTAT
jgi:hypothetical protein